MDSGPSSSASVVTSGRGLDQRGRLRYRRARPRDRRTGRARHRRQGRADAPAHRGAAGRRPRAPRRRARRRQDAARAHALRDARPELRARAVHGRPAARRRHRLDGLRPAARRRSSSGPGPLFANVVLADEINRATPRTQSAFLEAMEERGVTVDGDDAPAAGAVHRPRDAEPGRAQGHLPAARGAARPLPAVPAHGLPERRRRDADAGALPQRRPAGRGERRGRRGRRCRRCAPRSAPCTWPTTSPATSWR